ncbi:kinase domain-containing protein [Thermoascus aurantiacus ATCC 26904]
MAGTGYELIRSPQSKQPSLPRRFSDIGCHLIGPDYLVEEETLPFYEHDQYYPVRIGEVFKSRYQVVGKLGYGAYSTRTQNAALKVFTQLRKFPLKRRRELVVYEHLRKIRSSPMHLSILDMLESHSEPFNAPLLRLMLKHLLAALDFLHTEAGVVHTDLKAGNLMLIIADNSMLEDFEKAELENPSPRKIIDETRTIYTSRSFGKPKNGRWGYPVLCDFGLELGECNRQIQLHVSRAPEVTFEMPWGPPVDIWNLATLAMFRFAEGNYDPFKDMAQITGFLRLTPKEFMLRSETTSQCFDVDGRWKAEEHARIPTTSLEEVETRLEGRDKDLFLQFIRSMLNGFPRSERLRGSSWTIPG